MQFTGIERVSGSLVSINVKVMERRRYGNTTYCYVSAFVDGEIITDVLDGPWPATNYPKSAILWELREKFDIEPRPEDIRWLYRMVREKRCFVISEADQKEYMPLHSMDSF